MKPLYALGGGLAGACALTLIHETFRRLDPDAPRMDLLGMQAIDKLTRKAGGTPPDRDVLHPLSLAGDLVSNSLYYSLVGLGSKKTSLVRGALLGLGAGIGAVALPGPLGLDEAPSNRTTATKVMTVAWYLAGGMIAAGVAQLLTGKKK
jgi:hypothetical protein